LVVLKEINMTDKPSDITKANQDSKPETGGKTPAGAKRPEDAQSVTEVNEAANAAFNDDDTTEGITETRVGVLRGSAD
jgi:hypothetical protein